MDFGIEAAVALSAVSKVVAWEEEQAAKVAEVVSMVGKVV